MQSLAVNTVRESRPDGPDLSASLLGTQPTIAIAVTGRYATAADDNDGTGVFDNGEWTTFLSLLSAADRGGTPPAEHPLTLARRLTARRLEDSLLARRPGGLVRPCARYHTLRAFRDGVAPRRRALLAPLPARTQDEFCDKCCADSHAPAPSTFPGTGDWTFAAGADSFDAGRADGRRPAAPAALAPGDALPSGPPALLRLRDEVAGARARGLTDLRVTVEATESTSLGTSWDMYEMQTLLGTCLAETATWCAPERHAVNYRAAGVEEKWLRVYRGVFWVQGIKNFDVDSVVRKG